ncbi:hypothetical protein GCM10007216_01390 [Thalassobacillus devorans]|uniref:DUF2249 domain-containing protein n=1 Tax=Thalassobacillus devorans TaxID=279813 RepID=A0ABQ1NEB8_9BACI|nr:DUF2249 domain-containing protein [Thalassobacillus devorans]NIK27047.1 uncharacterized protein (DUF2249 family) [Thalassobacillus devorans]GGC74481.1 hypothetical protein GCM10007216_01390 [Thalassobacillus devorans]
MEEQAAIVELDVREDLKLKNDPFHKIMNAVKGLKEGESLLLHAPFKPIPLLKVMAKKGYDHQLEQIDPKHWQVTFFKRAGEVQ